MEQKVMVTTISYMGKIYKEEVPLHKQNFITIVNGTSVKLIPANQLNKWTCRGWKREAKNSLIPKGYKYSH